MIVAQRLHIMSKLLLLALRYDEDATLLTHTAAAGQTQHTVACYSKLESFVV